jgi:opacity protein-like surface antigen
MKKILIATLVLGTAQTALAHGSYNGWSVGASVGWVGASLKFREERTRISGNHTFNQVGFGIHADWAQSCTNKLFWGAGVGLGYHAGSPHAVFGQNQLKLNLKQQRKFYVEIAGRLGVNLGNAVLYTLVAVRGTEIEHRLSLENTRNAVERRKMVWGIAPGVGFDFKVNRNWSFGVEYRYLFEQQATLGSPFDAKLARARTHNVLTRVSYHF